MEELLEVINDILDYRIDEIGYEDTDDTIVSMCLHILKKYS